MVKRLGKLLCLPLDQLWVFIEAWYLFLKWDFLVSTVPYARWRNNIASSPLPESATTAESLPAIHTIINISEKAARNHLRKMNCLRRCLCQQQLLAKRKIASTLHFGVALEQGRVKAHCWLTWQGVLINDASEVVQQYTELTQPMGQSIEAMLLKP